MDNCTQCGKSLDLDSRFCKYCGAPIQAPQPNETPDMPPQPEAPAEAVPAAPSGGDPSYCAGCGARLPGGCSSCMICGTRAGEIPPPPQQQPQDPARPAPRPTSAFVEEPSYLPDPQPREPAPPYESTTRRSMRPLLLVSWIVILLLGAAIGAVALWPVLFPPSETAISEALLYIRGESTLCLKLPGEDTVEVSTGLAESIEGEIPAAISPDGRYLAYVCLEEEASNLYVTDLSRRTRPDFHIQGSLLAHNVEARPVFATRGNLLVFLDQSGGLFASDMKDVWQLDADVIGIEDVADKQLVYAKSGAPGVEGPVRLDIYVRSIARDADDKLLVAQNAAALLDHNKTYSRFLYIEQRAAGSGGLPLYDVSLYDTRINQSQTLAAGVEAVLEANAELGAVAFIKTRPLDIGYDDFVDDPFSSADEELEEPDPAAFGLPENYLDIFGSDTPDTDDRQQELELEDTYYESYTDYLEALDNYLAKLRRDAVRAGVRQSVSRISSGDVTAYGLYVYRDNATRTLEEELYSLSSTPLLAIAGAVTVDLENNYAVLLKGDLKNMARLSLADITDEDADFDAAAYLRRHLPNQLYYVPLSGASMGVVADEGQVQITGWQVTESQKGIYFTFRDRGESTPSDELYYAPITADGMQTPFYVDTDVYALWDELPQFAGDLAYLRGSFEDTFDLYTVTGGVGQQRLVRELSPGPGLSLQNAGRSLLYYQQYGVKGDGHGNLYLLTRTGERLIVGDIHGYDYRSDELIYLSRITDAGTNLYLYENGTISMIDAGVTLHFPDGN